MAEGLLAWCALPGGASKLRKLICDDICTAVDCYVIAQRSARLPSKQTAPGSNPCGVA